MVRFPLGLPRGLENLPSGENIDSLENERRIARCRRIGRDLREQEEKLSNALSRIRGINSQIDSMEDDLSSFLNDFRNENDIGAQSVLQDKINDLRLKIKGFLSRRMNLSKKKALSDGESMNWNQIQLTIGATLSN